MSNKKKNNKNMNLVSNDSPKNSEIVSPDGSKMEIQERDPETLKFSPHPNVIFATPAKKKETKSGIILPEGYKEDDTPSPIAKVLAMGENVVTQFEKTKFSLEVGDYVYVDASYMRFAKIDGVAGLILMADGILGKVPASEKQDK